MVVTVGIDVHKKTHCAVAVDEAGRQLGTVDDGAGHRRRSPSAAALGAAAVRPRNSVAFAVEDCRHVSARLERALLAAGRWCPGAAEADGADPYQCPDPGQVRSDRRTGHRPRGAARAGPAARGAQPCLPGAEAASRPPGRPGGGADQGAEPAPLAPPRARSRVRPARPRPGPAPATGPGADPARGATTTRTDRLSPDCPGDPRRHPRAHRADQRPGQGDHRTGDRPRLRNCWSCPAAGR